MVVSVIQELYVVHIRDFQQMFLLRRLLWLVVAEYRQRCGTWFIQHSASPAGICTRLPHTV